MGMVTNMRQLPSLHAEPGGSDNTFSVPRRRRRFRLGLRGRILGWYVILLAVASLASVLVARQLLVAQVDRRIDAQLDQEVEELRALADVGIDPETGVAFGRDVARFFEVFLQRNRPLENEAFLTFIEGEPYLRSRQVLPYRLDRDRELVRRWGGAEGPDRGQVDTPAGTVAYQVVPIQLADGVGGTFVVAMFREPEVAEVDDAVRTAALAGLITLAAGSLLAWQLAERILRPVRRMTEAAHSITETDLARRLEIDQQDELGDLARTLNEMLSRLEVAFTTQRRFIDDAGHELRTPLTAIRGHLELMEPSPEAHAETMPVVLHEVDRMVRIVNDLLLLAKAEGPDFLQEGTVAIDELVETVRTTVSTLGARDWRVEARTGVTIRADLQRLVQALVQLVHNAVVHTEEGDRITIGAVADAGTVELWVADAGPGVALADRAAIFERFRRAEGRRRSEGAGLGLAIVRAIAEAHGGSVRVETAPEGGARFVIELPRLLGNDPGADA